MILVFLHGKGSDKNAYSEQLKNLAEHLSVEFVSFNAPFSHQNKKGKFLWFNKFEQNSRRDAIKEEYAYALNYIEQKLQELNCPLSDIVLIGHSQGGGMAVNIGLRLNLKCVFSICGDLPYNLVYKNCSQTPIYWFEGKDDNYINQERKDSYKLLTKMGVNLHYQCISDCTHTEITSAFTEIEKMLMQIRETF